MQPAQQGSTRGMWTFGLSSLIVATALAGVLLGLLRLSLLLAVEVAPAFPAMMAMGIVARRWSMCGERMRPSQIIRTFSMLLFVSYTWTVVGAWLGASLLFFCGILFMLLGSVVFRWIFVIPDIVLIFMAAFLFLAPIITALCVGLRSVIEELSPPFRNWNLPRHG